MKPITYHTLEKNKYGNVGIQMREQGVPKGEYWPILEGGKEAAVIQLDDLVVCMSVLVKDGYYSAERQLDNLIDGYLKDPKLRVGRVLARGVVSIVKHPSDVRVSVGGVDLVLLTTYPITTALTLTYGDSRLYVDFLHPHLYDPLLSKSGYVPLAAALLPAKHTLLTSVVV